MPSVLADIEQKLGRRLSHEEIMARFEVNDNVEYFGEFARTNVDPGLLPPLRHAGHPMVN